MSHRIILLFTAGLLAWLAGCGKKAEPAGESKPEAKHEENIVALTPENLRNVSLRAEPATLGSLGMTLKAAGRISANLNKTAKVTSTFEGRVTKLNFDLNDRVKARELQADGTYRRLKPEGEEPRRQAQWQFREVSRERMKKLGGSTKKTRADRLVPIAVVEESGATGATKSETQ